MKYLVVLFVLLSCTLRAQEPEEAPLTPNEASLNDSGASVTVIARDEIEERKAPFVLDLLRTVPGVVVTQSGSAGKLATVFLRGASPDQTLVMIDGVRLTDSLGFTDLSSISTANVERIEIIRGAQSAMYGAGAMGGVINIVTQNGGPNISARLEGGSDSENYSVVRAGVGSDRNNLSGYFSRYDADGDLSNDDSQDRTFGLNAHLELVQGTNLGWIYRESKAQLGLPLNAGEPSLKRRSVEDTTLILIPFTQHIADWWNVEARYSRYKQDLHFEDPDDLSGPSLYDSTARTTQYGLLNRWATSRGDRITAGYEREELLVDNQDSSGFTFHNNDFITDSVYAQVQSPILLSLIATAGVRYDSNGVYGSKTSPRFGVTMGTNSPWRLHASVGSGFRAPRPLELAAPYGNPDLSPETVTSWDTGVDYNVLFEKMFVSGVYFHNDYSDLIGFDPSTSTLRNFKSVTASGVELAAEFQPAKNLNVLITYTHLNTKDKETGDALLRRPENSGNLSLNYRWRKIYGVFNWNFAGARFDLNEASLSRVSNDSYSNADLVLDYEIAGIVHAYGRITNLFDNRHQEVYGFPSPDRAFFLGAQLQY